MGPLIRLAIRLLSKIRPKPKRPPRELPRAKPKPKSRPMPKPGDVGTPLERVPSNAKVRKLTPGKDGGVQEGVEYSWVNQQGQKMRLRVHGPDGKAPPGSNSASGPTYRVQVGKRYEGPDGTLYPQGVFNPNSPNYNPNAVNDTHIPWPKDLPLPWE